MPFEPEQIVAGAFLGFAGAASLRWWQYRRDFWLDQLKNFSGTVEKAADAATEYWLQQKVTIAADQPRDPSSLDVKEAVLLGLQMRLDGMYATLEPRLSRADAMMVREHLNGLTDAMTGGNFESATRPADRNRARLAQMYASDLINEAGSAAIRAFTVKGWITFVWERVLPRQKMAVG